MIMHLRDWWTERVRMPIDRWQYHKQMTAYVKAQNSIGVSSVVQSAQREKATRLSPAHFFAAFRSAQD